MTGRLAITAAATIGALLSVPGIAPASPRLAAAPGGPSAATVADYWTAERMAAAKPLGVQAPLRAIELPDLRDHALDERPSSVPTAAPIERAAVQQGNTTAPGVRTHGKLFGSTSTGNFSCSATVVSATNESTVWTAGHCIYPPPYTRFATNLMFVPGYDVGEKPFGEWAAVNSYVRSNWVNSGGTDFRDDYGALKIETKLRKRTASERRNCRRKTGARKRRCKRFNRGKVTFPIQDAVGARGIAFSLAPQAQTFNAFGYPAKPTPRFDGQHLELCRSGFKRTPPGWTSQPPPIGIECDMGTGASGGGWVISGGRVNGNVSFGYSSDSSTIYSPYFSSFTQSFYNAVKSR